MTKQLVRLRDAHNIFIVGIKGVAMANLGLILKKMGKNVSGVDVDGVFITDELIEKNKIPWSIGFDPHLLSSNTDVVIYAASHEGVNNPIIHEAKKRNVAIMTQPIALEDIFSNFQTKIAVCGTHGKTTTTSLASHLFISLALKPSYLVGTPRFGLYWGGEYQEGVYFILEADEYGVNPPIDTTPKFHHLNPDYIIATNIDFDHPDMYDNTESVKKSFLYFFQKKSVKKIIGCYDDDNLRDVLNYVPKSKALTYGFSTKADLVIREENVEKHSDNFRQYFSASFRGSDLGRFAVLLFGKKNILNAASVILLSLELGFDMQRVKKALLDFTGAQRRCELVAQTNDVLLFDDYAHHPAEVEATIAGFRARFPDRRLIIIFQPHTFSRTHILKSAFATALSKADITLITDIYPSAREKQDQFPISSADIAKETVSRGQKNVIYHPRKGIIKFLGEHLRKGDVFCTMGAGDIYTMKNDIIAIMDNRILHQLEAMIYKKKLRRHVQIASYTTFKIVGRAEFYFEALTKGDIIACVRACHALNVRLIVLGGASNVVIAKEEIPGLVIRNLYREKKIIRQNTSEAIIKVSSGYPVSLLARETAEAGFSGLEYHLGLPGSVGGALYMNSKWTHPNVYVGDQLVTAELITQDGLIKTVDRDYFQFGYDASILQQTKEIVLTAEFKFNKIDKETVQKRMQSAFAYRQKTQPWGVFTSGCFFKNVGGKSAGEMIDALGLKGYSVGDFSISDKHANFIINKGNGKIEDLQKLVSFIKRKIKDVHGIILEEEVIYIR